MKNTCRNCISLFEIDGQIHCSNPQSVSFRQGFKWPGPGCEEWVSAYGEARHCDESSSIGLEVWS